MKRVIGEKSLVKVVACLNSLNKPWYINAGTALFLYGLKGDLKDIDIRVFDDDIGKLNSMISERYPGKTCLRPPLKYKYGMYDTRCIELRLDIKYDIYTEMCIIREGLGRVEFPFNQEVFHDVTWVQDGGRSLPVASLEFLLLYYLILRRNEFDEMAINEILKHKNFQRDKFERILEGINLGKEIYELHKEKMTKL